MKIKLKKNKVFLPVLLVCVLLFSLIVIRTNSPKENFDGWCSRPHQTNSYPPEKQISSMDFFELGNYQYDTGDCQKAIESYTKSIKLNPKYAQSHNNRGYTYMRLREFDKALPDLNMALTLNPNYVNALRNRADVYNHTEDYSNAINDYERAIILGGSENLCGDLFTLKHGKEIFGGLFSFPKFMIECSKSGK